MAELVDALVLETSAKAWGFESPYPHHPGKVAYSPERSRCLVVASQKKNHHDGSLAQLVRATGC